LDNIIFCEKSQEKYEKKLYYVIIIKMK